MARKMLRIPARTYGRKGKTIKRKSYLTPDRGKPGRTPKSKRWYSPKTEMGWEKDMAPSERRELALEAHEGDYLSTARALQALANVTTDKETKAKAREDAQYFFRLYRRER